MLQISTIKFVLNSYCFSFTPGNALRVTQNRGGKTSGQEEVGTACLEDHSGCRLACKRPAGDGNHVTGSATVRPDSVSQEP